MMKKTLIASSVLAVLAFAMPALAGPPFYCHAFDIGGAKSLPWDTHTRNWDGRVDYDITAVVTDTNALLTPATPVLVRMETLRRASLYASRDRRVAEQLIASVMSRVHDARQADAMAWFDAGYVIEALSELEQYNDRTNQQAGSRNSLAGITHAYEARPLLDKSAALRPADASIQFALALITPTTEKGSYLRSAREGARRDALLANNLARLQMQ